MTFQFTAEQDRIMGISDISEVAFLSNSEGICGAATVVLATNNSEIMEEIGRAIPRCRLPAFQLHFVHPADIRETRKVVQFPVTWGATR